jgi:hypothetical protein
LSGSNQKNLLIYPLITQKGEETHRLLNWELMAKGLEEVPLLLRKAEIFEFIISYYVIPPFSHADGYI